MKRAKPSLTTINNSNVFIKSSKLVRTPPKYCESPETAPKIIKQSKTPFGVPH